MPLKINFIFSLVFFGIGLNIQAQVDCFGLKQQVNNIKNDIVNIRIPDSIKKNQESEFFLLELFIEKNVISDIKIWKQSNSSVLSQFFEQNLSVIIGKKMTSPADASKIFLPVYFLISDNIVNLNDPVYTNLKEEDQSFECSDKIIFSDLLFKYDFTIRYNTERKRTGHTLK